jgi:hypothetical protein
LYDLDLLTNPNSESSLISNKPGRFAELKW